MNECMFCRDPAPNGDLCDECKMLEDAADTDPATLTPHQTELAAAIYDWYMTPGNEVGGAFHVELDDQNIDIDLRVQDYHTPDQVAMAMSPLGQRLMALWNPLSELARAQALGVANQRIIARYRSVR